MTTKSKVKKTVSKALNKNDLYHNLSNIKKALSDTTEGVKGRAHELVSDLLEDLQEKRDGYQESVKDYVDDEPVKALGIALAIGIAIGKFIL